ADPATAMSTCGWVLDLACSHTSSMAAAASPAFTVSKKFVATDTGSVADVGVVWSELVTAPEPAGLVGVLVEDPAAAAFSSFVDSSASRRKPGATSPVMRNATRTTAAVLTPTIRPVLLFLGSCGLNPPCWPYRACGCGYWLPCCGNPPGDGVP